MSSKSLENLEKTRETERRILEKATRDAYMLDVDADNDDYMRDLISAGLSATKRARVEGDDLEANTKSDQLTGAGGVEDSVRTSGKGAVSSEDESDTAEPPRETVCKCPWIEVLTGAMSVGLNCEIEGYGHFSTAKVRDCNLVSEGKWYYEVSFDCRDY
jgi:hypothetical protein